MRPVYIAGVGMTPFRKPGTSGGDYPALATEAARVALDDAGIDFEEIEQVCVGYVHAESTAGQRAVHGLGRTGVPVQNLTNNCASGSSALFYARQLVAGGLADCVLALGFEVMRPGPLGARAYPETTDPIAPFLEASWAVREPTGAPVMLDLFRNAALEHMERYGTTREQLAAVAAKNHHHSVDNPFAQFRDDVTLDDVLADRVVADPLTRLQCSPTSDGAAAIVVCSEGFAADHPDLDTTVEIAGQALASDTDAAFTSRSAIEVVGRSVSERAGRAAFDQAGLRPADADVVELHDCFSINEIITLEALGFCDEGDGGRLAIDGVTAHGGDVVVNPSGGLISKGHPLGATGLAQCVELTWQLRGEAGDRQVPDADVAVAHNLGLGSAAVVTVLRTTA